MTDLTPTIPTAIINTPVKPGWQTTEWWLALGAVLLTALYAGGVIPTTGPITTIAAMAATVLTALGYKVSRAIVKAAAVGLLAVFVTSTSMTACTTVKNAGTAIIDCTKANQPSIEALILEFRTLLQGQAPDWRAVEARAIGAGETIGGCALAELIAGETKPAGLRSADQGRATLEDFRARVAGGATFRTARGDL